MRFERAVEKSYELCKTHVNSLEIVSRFLLRVRFFQVAAGRASEVRAVGRTSGVRAVRRVQNGGLAAVIDDQGAVWGVIDQSAGAGSREPLCARERLLKLQFALHRSRGLLHALPARLVDLDRCLWHCVLGRAQGIAHRSPPECPAYGRQLCPSVTLPKHCSRLMG